MEESCYSSIYKDSFFFLIICHGPLLFKDIKNPFLLQLKYRYRERKKSDFYNIEQRNLYHKDPVRKPKPHSKLSKEILM